MIPGSANAMSQFQMFHNQFQQAAALQHLQMMGAGTMRPMCGLPQDLFCPSPWQAQPFGGGLPAAGAGAGYGMYFGGFIGGMGGFGGFPGMGGHPGLGAFGMNPMMLMFMQMMAIMQSQGMGRPLELFGPGSPFGSGNGHGGVKVSEGKPEDWYFQHGKYEKKDWVDPNTGQKIGWIQEGGGTRIYYNSERQTGYIYKKVEGHAGSAQQWSSVQSGQGGWQAQWGGAASQVSVDGWQLQEIRTKWEGKAASPVILDLDGSGTPDVHNGEWKPHAEQGDIGAHKVMFDLDGDGRKELTEWTGGKDGLLLKLTPEQVQQLQQSGTLEVSGRELYGDQGGQYADGYAKMRALSDANQDGVLSGVELQDHYTWQDANRDGKVDAGELASVQDKGISEIRATHGGDFQSSFTIQGQERKTWDWWPTTWAV